ncbi:hypothetical protein GCM10010377_64860 [Streptomyces viridiviolaceus]|nr:hypothetical protein GCM10010377_64860 [Streptomyces viridiviolaceus]
MGAGLSDPRASGEISHPGNLGHGGAARRVTVPGSAASGGKGGRILSSGDDWRSRRPPRPSRPGADEAVPATVRSAACGPGRGRIGGRFPGTAPAGGPVQDAGSAPGNLAPAGAPSGVASLWRRWRPKRPLRTRAPHAPRRVDGAYAPARTSDYAPAWYEL